MFCAAWEASDPVVDVFTGVVFSKLSALSIIRRRGVRWNRAAVACTSLVVSAKISVSLDINCSKTVCIISSLYTGVILIETIMFFLCLPC